MHFNDIIEIALLAVRRLDISMHSSQSVSLCKVMIKAYDHVILKITWIMNSLIKLSFYKATAIK